MFYWLGECDCEFGANNGSNPHLYIVLVFYQLNIEKHDDDGGNWSQLSQRDNRLKYKDFSYKSDDGGTVETGASIE